MVYFITFSPAMEQLLRETIEFDGYVWIGTEKSLPRAIDAFLARVWPQRWGTNAFRIASRAHGLFGADPACLRGPCQMEGGPAEAREVHRRFVHLRVEDHLYRKGADLLAFIEAHCLPWTGEHSWALGVKPLRMSREDRVAPAAYGLAGRLQRRRRG